MTLDEIINKLYKNIGDKNSLTLKELEDEINKLNNELDWMKQTKLMAIYENNNNFIYKIKYDQDIDWDKYDDVGTNN